MVKVLEVPPVTLELEIVTDNVKYKGFPLLTVALLGEILVLKPLTDEEEKLKKEVQPALPRRTNLIVAMLLFLIVTMLDPMLVRL